MEARELVLDFSGALPPAAVDSLVRKSPMLSPVLGTHKSKAETVLNIICTETGAAS